MEMAFGGLGTQGGRAVCISGLGFFSIRTGYFILDSSQDLTPTFRVLLYIFGGIRNILIAFQLNINRLQY
jgi:hypothetical protein